MSATRAVWRAGCCISDALLPSAPIAVVGAVNEMKDFPIEIGLNPHTVVHHVEELEGKERGTTSLENFRRYKIMLKDSKTVSRHANFGRAVGKALYQNTTVPYAMVCEMESRTRYAPQDISACPACQPTSIADAPIRRSGSPVCKRTWLPSQKD